MEIPGYAAFRKCLPVGVKLTRREREATNTSWASYDFVYPCPLDSRKGRHRQESSISEGDGDGDRCSACCAYGAPNYSGSPFFHE